MPRSASRLATVLLMAVWIAAPASSAAAFGTIDSGGQHREHERITRAALACAGAAGADEDCFEPRSMDFLAGHDREFGAVGPPTATRSSIRAAHCDNADFLAGGYPRTRDGHRFRTHGLPGPFAPAVRGGAQDDASSSTTRAT